MTMEGFFSGRWFFFCPPPPDVCACVRACVCRVIATFFLKGRYITLVHYIVIFGEGGKRLGQFFLLTVRKQSGQIQTKSLFLFFSLAASSGYTKAASGGNL